jgi:hypothetical protein
MTDKKNHIVELKWVGGDSRKDMQVKYRGDGNYCDIDHPQTCFIKVSEEQAYQLLLDMPTRWEILKGGEGVKEMLEEYQNRMSNFVAKPTITPKQTKEDDPNYNWKLKDLEKWADKNDVLIPDKDQADYKELNKTQKKSYIWKLIKEKINTK